MKRDRRTMRTILKHLEWKVDHLMGAVEDLQTAVTDLEGAETAAAAEFTALAEEIAGLQAGTISEAQVESLAQKAQAVAEALKTATPQQGTPPAPPAEAERAPGQV